MPSLSPGWFIQKRSDHSNPRAPSISQKKTVKIILSGDDVDSKSCFLKQFLSLTLRAPCRKALLPTAVPGESALWFLHSMLVGIRNDPSFLCVLSPKLKANLVSVKYWVCWKGEGGAREASRHRSELDLDQHTAVGQGSSVCPELSLWRKSRWSETCSTVWHRRAWGWKDNSLTWGTWAW